MGITSVSKFCSVCKLANKVETLVCEFCGTVLVDLEFGDDVTTRNIPIRRATDQAGNPYDLPTPAKGIAFFVFGKTESFITVIEDVFYFGRTDKDKESSDVIVDLTHLEAFNMGVSRKHTKIQRRGNEYEITDLFSSNGTFLNGQRMLPPKSYPLKSGMVIQLGRLKLIGIYS